MWKQRRARIQREVLQFRSPEHNTKAFRVPRIDRISKVSSSLLDAMLFCRVMLLSLFTNLLWKIDWQTC